MKSILLATTVMMLGHNLWAMPCDTGWDCKSKSGKYEIEVQRCRYVNQIRGLEFLKINGQEIKEAQLTASYDSLSIGGGVLALEVSIPDTRNDGHYLSFEYNGKTGLVTERIQKSNPGEQSKIASEPITCQESE